MDKELWTEDLTDPQLSMLIDSGHGVTRLAGGRWIVARRLQSLGLGSIGGDLFHINAEGVRILNEFADDDDHELAMRGEG